MTDSNELERHIEAVIDQAVAPLRAQIAALAEPLRVAPVDAETQHAMDRFARAYVEGRLVPAPWSVQ